jgi:hypothetical protein
MKKTAEKQNAAKLRRHMERHPFSTYKCNTSSITMVNRTRTSTVERPTRAGRPQQFRVVQEIALRLRCGGSCARVGRLIEIGSGGITGFINLDRTFEVRAVFDHDAGGG